MISIETMKGLSLEKLRQTAQQLNIAGYGELNKETLISKLGTLISSNSSLIKESSKEKDKKNLQSSNEKIGLKESVSDNQSKSSKKLASEANTKEANFEKTNSKARKGSSTKRSFLYFR